jgi:hypothetical protein
VCDSETHPENLYVGRVSTLKYIPKVGTLVGRQTKNPFFDRRGTAIKQQSSSNQAAIKEQIANMKYL